MNLEKNKYDGVFRIEGTTTLDGYFKGNGNWECYKCGLDGYFAFKSRNSWEIK